MTESTERNTLCRLSTGEPGGDLAASAGGTRGGWVGRRRIDHAEARRYIRVEKRHLFPVEQIEQLLRFCICHDEFNFDDRRSGKVQQLLLSKLVMPAEASHRLKGRAPADAELVGLYQQPFPNDVVAVALSF